MNVNHVRLLALIVKYKELTVRQIIDLDHAQSRATVMSRLHFLSRHKFIESRREKRNSDFIFYFSSDTGVDFICSLKNAIDDAEFVGAVRGK